VLSTQVLEHVNCHNRYLLEANRLLKPGGILILSTHGSFYDHGCPWDFRRWTAEGLKLDIENAGFRVEIVSKLTTNGRALAYLVRNFSWMLRRPRRHPIGMLSWAVSRFFEHPWNAAFFDQWVDQVTSKERIVPSDISGYPLYVGLFAYACKLS
jgi:SAM-dependent methyltransferase